ncbi:MAG: DUF262 domain-containing protein [Anaerolineae bacterium]|nr:DUF262 domain-containing protein [Anaerolineae bacterium]
MKLSAILVQIDMGSIALPEFQRGYVWNRDQVRKLMRSLYLSYPIGSLLMWETITESAHPRGDSTLSTGTVKLLLDGQQRITSLYGIIKGTPPPFFDGDATRFTGLYFNLETEEFEFYGPVKMQDDPLWIDVSELMQIGAGRFAARFYKSPILEQKADVYLSRVTAIDSIKDRDFHVDTITGENMTVDTVVEIFNAVNSSGTTLSKGDLALAKICASWPEARDEMKSRLTKWEHAGFNFKLDWLLRCINTTLTGESLFVALKDVRTAEFAKGLKIAEHHIDFFLNLIASRLGLDHDRVLGSRYSFPLLVRYLQQQNGHLANHQERDQLLYWYIHTFLWGRYSGSTESVLQQDLNAIRDHDGGLERLINQLHQNRGELRLYARDFEGATKSNRFYPLLYMLTRVWHARDWETGVELTAHLLGRLNSLQVHHIFPKALLYDYGYSQHDVNAIANFTFLTQETNLNVSDRNPIEYLDTFEARNPGAVQSHWIPMDRGLWQVERYLDFLAARRELLAQAANNFLNSLLSGRVPEARPAESILDREAVTIYKNIASDEEDRILRKCQSWMEQQNLPSGEFSYELVDENSKEVLVVLDLAWPSGIQEGKSEPVALLIDEEPETLKIAQSRRFRCFTDIDSLISYIQSEILGEQISN